MSKQIFKMAAFAALLATTGCASIVDGANQSLSVKTVNGASDVGGAQCELDNSKGSWFVTTPGSVTVHRAFGDLTVKCNAPGYSAAPVKVSSTTKAMALGNAVFGGVVGVGVDMSTGAAYDYPELITVPLQPATSSPVAGASTKPVS